MQSKERKLPPKESKKEKMKISCCVPGGSFMPQGENEIPMSSYDRLTEGARIMEALGYDCTEATVGLITSLTEEETEILRKEAAAGRFKLYACNSFIPGSLPIITDAEGTKKLYDYVENAVRRMASLGIRYVVFGSGRVRTIPGDSDRAAAEAQIDAFITHIDACCEAHGMTCVIEPLNKLETNWCNTVAEGAAVVRRLNLKHIKLLADSYHMSMEGEDLSVIAENRDIILHCHISSEDRKIPGGTTYEGRFLDTLKKIGYDGIVTVECGFTDFRAEAAAAADYLRAKLAE